MSHSRPSLVVAVVCLLAAIVPPVSARSRNGVRSRGVAGASVVAESKTAGGTSGTGELAADDGSYEEAVGVVDPDGRVGSQAVYLNAFSPEPDALPITIDTVSALFPVHDRFGSTGLFPKQSFDMLVYLDPDGTGDPRNAELANRTRFDLEPSDTTFQAVALSQAVTVTAGDVYIGFTDPYVAVTEDPIYPAAVDTDTRTGVSYAFHNTNPRDHFDGEHLSEAQEGGALDFGTFLIRASYTTGGSVRICWDPAAGDGAPPTNNRLCTPPPGSKCGECSSPAITRGAPTGYNVYRGTSPNVEASPANYFTSVPAGTTTVSAGVTPGGSFFVVTATYDTGESDPSNEVSVVPPTVTSLVVKGSKVTVTGSGFSAPVQILVDGVPFAAPAKVKGGTKVKQKGALVTGETASAYLTTHDSARFTVLNSTGALTAITKP